jgi:hypothetical protein
VTIVRPAPRRPRSRVALAIAAALVFTAGASGCSATDPGSSVPPSSTEGPTASAPGETPTPIPSSTPDATSPVAEPAPFHPEVGQCLDVRKDRRSGPDSIVPCAEVHDDEAYAAYALDAAAYPGVIEAERLATAGCQARLADFIGIPYEDSELEVYAVLPTAETWGAGDRKVTCLVWYPADSVVGSLQGAAF